MTQNINMKIEKSTYRMLPNDLYVEKGNQQNKIQDKRTLYKI